MLAMAIALSLGFAGRTSASGVITETVTVTTDNGFTCTATIFDVPTGTLISAVIFSGNFPGRTQASDADNATAIEVLTGGTAGAGATVQIFVAAGSEPVANCVLAAAGVSTSTPTATVPVTSTPTSTATVPVTATATSTDTVPVTATATVPVTATATPTQTATATATQTATATATQTATATPTQTATATPTQRADETEVEIVKLFCENEDFAGEVEFEVLGPEFPFDATDITGQAGTEQPDSCTPGAAEFEIFLNGEKKDEADFEISVDEDGLIILRDLIPATDEGESHKIVEVGTGAEAVFEVEEGAVTKIIVINFVGEGEAPTATPDDKDKETPAATKAPGATTAPGAPAATTAPTTGGTKGGTTALPNTGAGAGQRGMELGLLALLAIAGLGAAGLSVRRRAA